MSYTSFASSKISCSLSPKYVVVQTLEFHTRWLVDEENGGGFFLFLPSPLVTPFVIFFFITSELLVIYNFCSSTRCVLIISNRENSYSSIFTRGSEIILVKNISRHEHDT